MPCKGPGDLQTWGQTLGFGSPSDQQVDGCQVDPELDKGPAGEAERRWSPTSSPDPSQVSGLRLSEPQFPLL